MSQEFNITVLPGDGIGPEVIREAVKILKIIERKKNLKLNLTEAPVGGAGYEASGHPLPDDTLKAAQSADAVLLGAVGGTQVGDHRLFPATGTRSTGTALQPGIVRQSASRENLRSAV